MKKIALGLVSVVVSLVFCVGCSAPEEGKQASAKGQKIQVQKEQDPEEIALRELNPCRNLTNNAATILKDFKTIDDESYAEVTMISPDAWDRERLPREVLELEDKGYACSPIPLSIEMPVEGGDPLEADSIHSEPVVTSVRWNCELEYVGHKYLEASVTSEKENLENQGYKCEKIDCRNQSFQKDFVWFCSK